MRYNEHHCYASHRPVRFSRIDFKLNVFNRLSTNAVDGHRHNGTEPMYNISIDVNKSSTVLNNAQICSRKGIVPNNVSTVNLV